VPIAFSSETTRFGSNGAVGAGAALVAAEGEALALGAGGGDADAVAAGGKVGTAGGADGSLHAANASAQRLDAPHASSGRRRLRFNAAKTAENVGAVRRIGGATVPRSRHV
jgi:hypothetical protein